ncbi:hypothetical protein C8Q69DRAFT_471432 [Paecilomyces variotii]|uniref:RING-type domain-containing protein n=1 Tax=Byssochlamys spectabilis TaxID=264951 RepID=A0A443HSG6_BYSSP|nr:hypothetical protein C8Q69DRAFT_471432 [Paecilomyces variotii]RWQ94757.1 hypothetical protein C8Q69DRAFT_471432 [Paecilomyces variotii]
MDRSSPSVVDLAPSSSHQPPAEGSSSRHFPPIINSSRDTSQSSSRSTEAPPRGAKRRRLDVSDPSTRASSSSAAAPMFVGDDSNIESVDLTEVEDDNALSKALAKQREDAIRAQGPARDGEGRSVLTAYKCPVCMDTPVDATSTICGHLFCHKCIIDTLKFSEEQRSDSSGKGPRGNCPVCRKPLTRNDVPGPRRNLVPLTLKLMTKKRDNHQPREPQTTESI